MESWRTIETYLLSIEEWKLSWLPPPPEFVIFPFVFGLFFNCFCCCRVPFPLPELLLLLLPITINEFRLVDIILWCFRLPEYFFSPKISACIFGFIWLVVLCDWFVDNLVTIWSICCCFDDFIVELFEFDELLVAIGRNTDGPSTLAFGGRRGNRFRWINGIFVFSLIFRSNFEYGDHKRWNEWYFAID